jgi:hypothetical protein
MAPSIFDPHGGRPKAAAAKTVLGKGMAEVVNLRQDFTLSGWGEQPVAPELGNRERESGGGEPTISTTNSRN